jgi:hypothetical protein
MSVPTVQIAGYRRPFVHDRWAGLSHAIGDGIAPILPAPGLHPWMSFEDRRRLLAYQYLDSVADNVRRYWLPASMWHTPADATGPQHPAAMSYREYGEAGNLCDTARGLVLGDEQKFRVKEAQPARGPGGSTSPAPSDALPGKTQAWLDDWSEKEQLVGKLQENEQRTIRKGDGVIVVAWSKVANRPKLRVYDAGFYFPDHDATTSRQYREWEWDDEDHPPVDHIAWETPKTGVLRRITYRMVRLPSARPLAYGGTAEWTCMFEEVDIDLGSVAEGNVYTWPAKGRGITPLHPPIDLGVDFSPVLHTPNTYAGGELWGESILTRVAQILDDVNAANTDLAISSETVASSKLITKNAGKQPQGGAGEWFDLLTDGDVSVVDTSKTLDALLKHVQRLEVVLARHSRLGEVLMGMVSAAEVPSGYAMRLGFASAAQLEADMKRVRLQKYGLIGKFAVRLAQAMGQLPNGPTPTIQIALGRGLPADRAAAIEEVAGLLVAKAISVLTGVQMLMDAGLPIEDAAAEVARIRAENPAVAADLVGATGDVQAARDWLGLKGPGPDLTPPAQQQPGQPGDQTRPPGAPPAPGSPNPADRNAGGSTRPGASQQPTQPPAPGPARPAARPAQ